jgi:bifunctional non-homologous end joining protein LigD
MPTDLVVPSLKPAGLPQVDPVPLVPRPDAFDDPAWVFEPKYDGYRALLYRAPQSCEIDVFGNRGLQIHELQNRMAEVLRGREAILDGDLVSLDRQGKPVLQHLLRGEGYPAFAARDLLWLDGTDLRDLPLKSRKQHLAELLRKDTGPLYKVLSIEEHGRALFGAIRRLDLRGIIAKCQDDPYSPAAVWYEIANQGASSPTYPWATVYPAAGPAFETSAGSVNTPPLTHLPTLA